MQSHPKCKLYTPNLTVLNNLLLYSGKQKNMLEMQASSNIMLIDPLYKQAQIFNQSFEMMDHDMTPMILGEVQ